MAYVSERISQTKIGCLFAAHVSMSKYDIFYSITIECLVLKHQHSITFLKNLTKGHYFSWFMQRNKMQLRGNNKVLLPEEG